VVFAFVSPAALVVYFVVSNLYRIGMQAYITRSLYHGEDSLGAQAQKASLEAKKLKEEAGGGEALPRIGRRARAVETTAADTTPPGKPAAQGTTTAKGGGNGTKPVAPTARTTGTQNRSKKKKKRR